MSIFTDKPLHKKDLRELGLRITRSIDNKDGEHFIYQMEWEKRLMKERHKLNRQTVIISVICSSIFGMIGVMGGVLLQYHLGKTQKQTTLQKQQYTYTQKEDKKPLKELRAIHGNKPDLLPSSKQSP